MKNTAVLDEACALSCSRWVAGFPVEVPPHIFHKAFTVAMERLLTARARRKHGVAFRALAVATALAALVATAMAVPASREYILSHFDVFTEYNVNGIKDGVVKKVTSLTVGYVPEGVVLDKENSFYNEAAYIETYTHSKNEKRFVVEKHKLDEEIGFDTEEYEPERIIIKGFTAICFRASDEYYGILYNDGNYIYIIGGTLEREELVQIAQKVR